MKELARSDLAAECGVENEREGIRVVQGEGNGCPILHVHVKTEEAAARLRKPMGHYVSVECGNVALLEGEERERVCRAIGVELRSMAEHMCRTRPGRDFSVLVVGLGNREITPDAIGPETVRALSVNRHCIAGDPGLSRGRTCRLSAIVPGVPAATGLETVETVRGLATEISPDLIVAVDALAARSMERLGSTVQLSDSGIQPGSGLGEHPTALTRETVGVPVLSLGLPTVVRSDALALDLLSRAGLPEPEAWVRQAMKKGEGYVVSPKEIDLLVLNAGVLLAGAIERAFLAL